MPWGRGMTAEPLGWRRRPGCPWLLLKQGQISPTLSHSLPSTRVGISPNAYEDQCTIFHCFSSALSEALFETLGYVFVLVKSFTFTDPVLSFIQRHWICQGPPSPGGNVPGSAKQGMQQSVVVLSYSTGKRKIPLKPITPAISC